MITQAGVSIGSARVTEELMRQESERAESMCRHCGHALTDDRNEVDHLLNRLTPQLREVIYHRFGLYNTPVKTLREVGQLMGGISAERARQLEAVALRKMRAPEKMPFRPAP